MKTFRSNRGATRTRAATPKSSLANLVTGRCSRPPLVRMLRIHERLRDRSRQTNCRQLARELEVSYKTVQRDIDFMRDQMELPIDYDRTTKGFFYTRPVVQFPSVQVSEGELVALFVARRALEQYQGTAFEKPLRAAFEKLTAALPEQIGFGWEQLDAALSFRGGTVGRGTADVEIFQIVSQAVLRREELEFEYRKPSLRLDQRGDRRRVQGLHLGCFDNQWYLIGQDQVRAATRTFVLGRMAEVRNTKKRFTPPSSFNLERLLAGSFGVFTGLGTEHVRLRFVSGVASLVRERVWHPSQKVMEGANGAVELQLEVGVSPEVERWILGWGDSVEVIAPAKLRDAVLARARGVLAAAKNAPTK
jgi:predicted DNA-binding transcriptional regulator YafY